MKTVFLWLVLIALFALFALADSPVTITTTSLPSGQVAVAYSQGLVATGGAPPSRWSITTGALPAGLSLSPAGQISGTPSTAGTANFTVKAADGTAVLTTKGLSIDIEAAPVVITPTALPSGEVGVAYSQSLAASGGTPPYTWSITTGALPASLSLSSSGQISGTPSAAGATNFTVKATDHSAASASKALSINVATAPAITTTSLPNGQVGTGYSQSLAASGGTPPYTWSISAGTLPAGLSLSPAGQISGTPSAAGATNFTVKATDGSSAFATKALSINIASLPVRITTTSLPSGQVGGAYSQNLAASGGIPPFTWSISAGALPAGLSLSPAGQISGTPSAAGTANFTIHVSDSASGADSLVTALIIQPAPLTVTTTSLANGSTGVPYSQTLQASGGTPPYSWSLSSGTLPRGLTLSTSGSITGRPATSGNFKFTVRVTDRTGLFADRPLSIGVISSISLGCPAANAVGGLPFSSSASASGGQPPYTWMPAAGLPAGLSLSTAGQLTGVPTDIGTFSYTLAVSDSTGASASQQCALTVAANLTILTVSVPDASQFSQYSQSLSAGGGNSPYLWSVSSGSLPPGLNLSSTGLLSGSATQLGLFNFTVKVMDSSGASAQKPFSINVFFGLIVAACPPSAVEIGLQVGVSLAAVGGTPPYKWSVSNGGLPQGLTLVSSPGTIGGTPTQSGAVQFTLVAADSTNQTATRQCTMNVELALSISTSSLASSITGATYSDTVAASGGQPPYIWSTTGGSLPPGLSLNAGTGQITGTAVAAGTFGFTVQATDSIGAQATKDLAITISQGLTIPNCPAPIAVIGQPYSAALAVVGGSAPYQWTISSGTLPSGLSLDAANALVAGVPSQVGSSGYVLQVNDSSNKSATRACTIQVNRASLTITPASLPDGVVGVQYSTTLAASGGQGPYSWSIVSAGAPDGFSLDASGALTGTASTAGAFSFTVQVTDQANNVAAQTFTLNIQSGTPPNVAIVGLPDIVEPAQQPTFSLQLDSTYPADITGAVTLTFTPDPAIGVDDPAIQFATGGRVLQFTLPANSNTPTFSTPILAFQTGTVAGSIQLAVSIQSNSIDITAPSEPVRTVRIDRLAPKIISLTAVPTSSGVELHLTSFTTTRQVTQGVFQFQPANGAQAVQVVVPLADGGTAWFQSAQSMQFGGEFSLIQPFTFQGQSLSNFGSVSVTLSNAQGNSDALSVKF